MMIMVMIFKSCFQIMVMIKVMIMVIMMIKQHGISYVFRQTQMISIMNGDDFYFFPTIVEPKQVIGMAYG